MANQKITQLNELLAPDPDDYLVMVDDPAGSPETKKIEHENLFKNIKILNILDPSELTISSGEITITRSFHEIDTEGDAASDDLETINGGSIGDILILKAINSSRVVTCKDNTGNLRLAGDFALNNNKDSIMLVQPEADLWIELSRSNNA